MAVKTKGARSTRDGKLKIEGLGMRLHSDRQAAADWKLPQMDERLQCHTNHNDYSRDKIHHSRPHSRAI